MAQAEGFDVFLSYRRASGVKDAMLIKLALENRGYRVFFDLSGLGAGTFGQQLYQRIDECRDFILIVSPHALDNCKNERDWLRREVEYAREKGKNIVPVLIDVSSVPDDLPEPIRFIKDLQSLKFSFEYFDHYNYFVTFIDTVSGYLQSKPVLSTPKPSSPTPKPPARPAFVPGRDNVLTLSDDLYGSESEAASAKVFSTELTRKQITGVTFLDSLADAPRNARDFSEEKNRSVLGWTRASGRRLYELFIAGEGGVSAPENCEGLFQGYVNATRIEFNGAFHTERTASFVCMFQYCKKLSALDVSGFDTSKVTDMYGMFFGCSRLSALDVSGFDTSKVTDMRGMFYGCTGLTSLDVSGFDFSHVVIYYGFMPDSLDPNWRRYFERG